MERISVFDIFKVGIGPSSSHTMGPWKAALMIIDKLRKNETLKDVQAIQVTLYGTKAKTGKGHGVSGQVHAGILWLYILP